jgi:phosphoglycolate phosphatase
MIAATAVITPSTPPPLPRTSCQFYTHRGIGAAMTDFPFDIVGFDLDGTLFDTSPDLGAAVNHALGLIGRAPIDGAAVRTMVGRGTRVMLQSALEATGGFAESDLDRLYPELLTYYEANIVRGSTPYPGLIDALDTLAVRGVTLAIMTNKFEHLAVKLIREIGMADRFACIIGGDTMGPGNAKPSAVPIHAMIDRCGGGRAAFVGDSVYDVQAAKNAGVPSVVVTFGFSAQPVEELGADAVISSYAELIPALERLA